jgi:hypothetical protein
VHPTTECHRPSPKAARLFWGAAWQLAVAGAAGPVGCDARVELAPSAARLPALRNGVFRHSCTAGLLVFALSRRACRSKLQLRALNLGVSSLTRATLCVALFFRSLPEPLPCRPARVQEAEPRGVLSTMPRAHQPHGSLLRQPLMPRRREPVRRYCSAGHSSESPAIGIGPSALI